MGRAMEDRAFGFLTEALPGALAFGFGLGVEFETGGTQKKTSRVRGPNQVDQA